MLLLEAQNISYLFVCQRRFPLAHLPRNRRIRTDALQILLRRHLSSNCIIRRIKNLKSKPVLTHTQITNLSQIPRLWQISESAYPVLETR